MYEIFMFNASLRLALADKRNFTLETEKPAPLDLLATLVSISGRLLNSRRLSPTTCNRDDEND